MMYKNVLPPDEFVSAKSHKLILGPQKYYIYLFKSNGAKNPLFKIKNTFIIKKSKEQKVEVIEDQDSDELTTNEIIETGSKLQL